MAEAQTVAQYRKDLRAETLNTLLARRFFLSPGCHLLGLSTETLKWSVKGIQVGMCGEGGAQATKNAVIPGDIERLFNDAARPSWMNGADPISVFQWARRGVSLENILHAQAVEMLASSAKLMDLQIQEERR